MKLFLQGNKAKIIISILHICYKSKYFDAKSIRSHFFNKEDCDQINALFQDKESPLNLNKNIFMKGKRKSLQES